MVLRIDPEAMGRKLQKWRKKAKYSQHDSAKLLGYSSPQFISNIERGLAAPPEEMLKKLLNFYDVPHNQFLSFVKSEVKKILDNFEF